MNNKSASINVVTTADLVVNHERASWSSCDRCGCPTTSTVTSIEFKDVGVKLTVEPTVDFDEPK